MGWTFTHRPKGISHLDWFRRELTDPGEESRLIDIAAKGNVLYAAYRSSVEEGAVIGIAILTQWAPKDEFNFGWKYVSEDMGPADAQCPDRILDLLTPVEEAYGPIEPPVNPESEDYRDRFGNGAYNAQQWRDRSRAYNAAKAAKPKPKKGDTVVFPEESWVAKRLGTQRFTFGGRNLLITPWGGRYNVSKWREERYEVEAA